MLAGMTADQQVLIITIMSFRSVGHDDSRPTLFDAAGFRPLQRN